MFKTHVKAMVKGLAALKLIALALLVGLAWYASVPIELTAADKKTFQEMGFESLSFEQQVQLVRKVQTEVFKRAPMGAGIPDFKPREPADLMRYGQGLCYDRSRTFDKAFAYLGFESRHVYLLYRENLGFFSAFFRKGQPSHAVTEVKTLRGWLFVDSNSEWIAVTRSGEPVGADDVWRRIDEFDNPPSYLRDPWWAIRGLYSRKGQFYGAGIMFPELNWSDFLSWILFEF